MPGYREFRFYSPQLDTEAARLSMVDGQGREYFAVIDAGSGRGYRERREAALSRIEDAIMAGEPPGEVARAPLDAH